MPSAYKILGPHSRLLCGHALGWECLPLRVQRLRRSVRSTFTAAITEGERTAKLGTPEARESKVVAKGSNGPKRFAVIGGGFAGVATAWNLLAMTGGQGPTSIHLFDAVGLAGGGSGAAAGLLHPYSPKGKMMWQGREALVAALKLISAAEMAASMEDSMPSSFVWRQPILRPAANKKQAHSRMIVLEKMFDRDGRSGDFAYLQAKDFTDHGRRFDDLTVTTTLASPVTAEQALQLVPGLVEESLLKDSNNNHAAALLIQGGLVLDPYRYLRALWAACKHITQDAGGGAEVRLIKKKITSLHALEAEFGPYSAVVVAAGAANGLIEDVGDQLDCTLSQGYVLQLVPPPRASQVPSSSALPNVVERAAPAQAGQLEGTACGEASQVSDEGEGYGEHVQSSAEGSSPANGRSRASGRADNGSRISEIKWSDTENAGSRGESDLAAAGQASESPQAASDQQLTAPPDGKGGRGAAHLDRSVRDGNGATAPEKGDDVRKADDEDVLISDLDVGARTGSLHFKRTFTPAFSLDTGPSFHVRGERPDFDSCLRQPATEAWESQQQQIRTTIGLQINPTKSLPSAEDWQALADAGDDWKVEEEEGSFSDGYPEGAPSLLSSKFLAVQGGKCIVLGATKRPGLTPQEAFQECGRKIVEAAEVEAATAALMPDARRLWQPISDWRVRRVRTGVRALPPRTEKGAIPLAGRLRPDTRWWVVGGLGARGLVYHAWLGELIAQAVLNDSEEGLPKELLRWQACRVEVPTEK